MKRHKTAVIALGNDLMADDGAALHAIRMLEEKLTGMDVDLIEARTCGMNLIHQFEDRKKIIFIDSGNCGILPGQFKRFRREEVNSLKTGKNYSMHDFDLIGFIDYARKLNNADSVDIVIYCIQANEIKPDDRLSQVVEEALPLLVDQVVNEIKSGIIYN